MSIVFHVPGPPVPKARARVYTAANGTIRAVTPKATKEYQEAIGWAFKEQHAGPPLTGPLGVHITVREGPGRSGDIDNYVKAILDGLNRVAWLDDGQVCELAAELHRYSTYPSVDVMVWTIGEEV